VVLVVSVWRNIPCRVQRLHVVHHLHRLLSAAKLSNTGPTVVHRLHSGPCSYSGEVRVFSLHAFADDTQLYLHRRRTDTASAADLLEQCITDVGRWMSANRL